MLRRMRGVGAGVRQMRAPDWVRTDAVGLIVALVVVGGGTVAGLAAAGVIESEPAASPATQAPPAPELHARLVAHRVERLRRLEFDRIPAVRVLGPADFDKATHDIALRGQNGNSDGGSSRRVRRIGQAAQYLLKLAAVVPPEFAFANAQQELGLEVAGVYDPVRKRILFPREIAAGDIQQAQGYLAHELTHALDDQHFGIELPENANPFAESTGAFEALGEGDASYVQLLYARRYGSSFLSPRQELEQQAANVAAPLTPPLTQAALFPYVDGASFVAALHQRGGWELVNRAWRSRPPRTSQQVLHPDDYLADVRPPSVGVPPANVLGSDWSLVARGTVGEEDTRVLLGVGLNESVSARIANGWRGARFEVWRRRGAPPCIGACRADTAAIVAWRWWSAESAELFAGGLHDYARLGFLAKPAGPLTWRVDDGYMAAVPLAQSSSVAFSPNPEQARKLASTAALRAE